MPSTNPYTFVPLGQSLSQTFKNVRAADKQDTDLITGVIRCELTTKKKLIVPAVERGADGLLPFFQLPYGPNAKMLPAIPGSSIRGVIRSVYETITHSCMHPNEAHDKRLASTGGLKQPGLLYFDVATNKYVLCKAQRHKVWDEKKLCRHRSTGDVVDFAWAMPSSLGGKPVDKTRVVTKIFQSYPLGSKAYVPADVAKGTNAKRGVFLKVNKLNDSHPSVFVGNGTIDNDVSREFIDALADNARRYKENNSGSAESKAYLACLKAMKEGTCVLPVWYAYQTIGGKKHYQFAYAQLSRVVYPKSVNDFYRQQGVAPCTSEDALCPACSLFGFVSPLEGDESARASRIRFGDALLRPDDAAAWPGFGQYQCWLPELLEPRASSFEFYLRNTKTPHVFTPELPDTELAGRKYYWHHSSAEQTEDGPKTSKEKNEVLNCEAQYVPENTHFQFSVFVDGVTKRQLNELLYALTLGEYWDAGKGIHCHKMGRGKPYGFGSTHVTVTDLFVRNLAPDAYAVTHVEGAEKARIVMSQDDVESGLINVKAIRNVTLLDAGGRNVAYPRAGKDNTIFKWFFDNRELFARTQGLPGYKTTLPSVPNRGELDAAGIARNQSLGTARANRSTLEDEAQRASSASGVRPRQQSAQPSSGTQRMEGRVRSAKFSASSNDWFGQIARDGQSDIFFHTSRSPQLDLKGQSIEPGMKVTFVEGKNTSKGKHYGSPIACDIQIKSNE